MTVYGSILSVSGWSLSVLSPIVPGCFFRVWVTVWVKTRKRSREGWNLTHYDRFRWSGVLTKRIRLFPVSGKTFAWFSAVAQVKVMQKLHRSGKERVCAEREAGRRVCKVTNCLNPGGAIENTSDPFLTWT